jgi:spore coat polysaccharide biosynthesis protein SpsF
MPEPKDKKFGTPQEAFWAGEFGDEYATRNRSERLHATNISLFASILSSTSGIQSVIEYGANIGMNLVALKRLLPGARLAAVEINEKAAAELRALGDVEVHNESILDFAPSRAYDFVLTKGVLIHLNPEELPRTYDLLHRSASRYICIAEYYNPTPVTVTYRGHTERLFKRDFAGDMLDRFPDLAIVKYGFAYHRDPVFPQDDITWFLLEKQTSRAHIA